MCHTRVLSQGSVLCPILWPCSQCLEVVWEFTVKKGNEVRGTNTVKEVSWLDYLLQNDWYGTLACSLN